MLVALFIGAVVLAAVTSSQQSATFTMQGSLTSTTSFCWDLGVDNASLVVRGETNQVIGAGATLANLANLDHLHGFNDVLCRVKFSVTLPRASMYQTQIGTHGGPTYSFDELQARHWTVALSLG